MLFFELKNRKEIDYAPPRVLASQLAGVSTQQAQDAGQLRGMIDAQKSQTGAEMAQIKNEVCATSAAVGGVKASQSTLFRDLSATKSEVLRKTSEIQQTLAMQTATVDAVKRQTQDLAPLGSQVTRIAQTIVAQNAAVDDVRRQVSEVKASDIAPLSQQIAKVNQQANNTINALFGQLDSKQGQTNAWLGFTNRVVDQIGEALGGNVHLVLDDADEDVSAALLNAAAVGTFQRTFLVAFCAQYTVDLETINHRHEWTKFNLVLTPAETCTDPQIGVPTVDGATLMRGVAEVVVTFDTDAGATKTYEVGDVVTVDAQVNIGGTADKWFGVDVAKVTKTYTVIA